MLSLIIAALAAQSLAFVVPNNERSTYGYTDITRSFTLPPLPIETGWNWGRDAEAAADAKAEAGSAAEEKRENFGTGPDPTQVQITGVSGNPLEQL